MDTTISNIEVARAVTNDAADYFVLGDRKFKIVDLEYDDYVAFLAKLQPLAEAVFGKVLTPGEEVLISEGITPGSLIQYCAKSLPEMVCIVCRQTDPDIEVDDVKKLAKTPFKLAAVVLKQIEQNNMIADFMDFFGLMLPLMKKGMAGMKLNNQESTTKEIPSSSSINSRRRTTGRTRRSSD